MKPSKSFTRFIVLILATWLLAGCGSNKWKTTDDVEVLSESTSPDGKYVVTVFSCSGGGAAGYVYTNVNLRKASETLNQRDFLLGENLWRSFSDISATWKDSTSLEISYRWASDHPDYKVKNGQTVAKVGTVRINYVIKGEDSLRDYF